MATLSDLERMLSDESEDPKALPLSLLFDITKGFSDDLKIGSGGFAVVYKGILGNGLVAVKRLNNSYMIDEEFLQEVKCLIKVKHQNVVRFLGYCADTQGVAETYNGNFVMADVQQRLFCFEYVPNGNLGAYISEASHGLEWRKRYQIIKGICEGLNYLHQNNIVHSDLNPANILLDNNMVPKIADFGVSRCFRDNQSGDILTKVVGTMGYMAPEFFSGKIKLKSDIYSLGVIITEIVTGKRHSEDEDVIEIWRNRLERSKEHSQLEQVKVCVKLGTECTEFNPGKRPPIQLIIDRLAGKKCMDWSIKTAVSLTVEQGEKASNELCQSTFKLSGDGSSESYNDGEHVLPAKRSLTFGPCSVTSHESEGIHKAARFGETSRDDADVLEAESKSSHEIIRCSTTNMTTGVLSNHMKSESHQMLANPSNSIADATATGAGLGDKQSMGNLHLSWKGFSAYPGSEPSSRREMEKSLPTEALEFLELHNNLKNLRISGYDGAASPSWFASNMSVTSLKALHLEDCGEWRILPSLERLPFLAKLTLSDMPEVIEVSVPSLKQLVLVKMPKLESCSCISMRGLNSRLRVLKIKECPALKVFDLFGNGDKFEIDQESWLPYLCELTIRDCPHLRLPHPVPPSSSVSRISMHGVLKFRDIQALSCQTLTIGKDPDEGYFDKHSYNQGFYHEISDELFVLDDGILAFHNLSLLTHLTVSYCRNLTSIPFNGLRQLVSLKKLKISDCPRICMLDVPPENGHEDLTAANYNVFPSLEYLYIYSCGIAWESLSLMLQGAPALRELDLLSCGCLESLHLHYCTALERVEVVDCRLIGEVKGLHKLQSLRNFDLSNSQFLKSLELHSCTALQELSTWTCDSLKVLEGLESLSGLRRLTICNALELLSGQQGYEQCPRLESLQIDDFNALTTSFFLKQRASLKRLCIVLSKAERLTEEQESELLLLSSLEDLDFSILPYLEDLPAGLHSHPSLKRLVISRCPRISRLPEKGLPPSLEKLVTWFCSDELNDQCRMLASSKLRVQTLPHMN